VALVEDEFKKIAKTDATLLTQRLDGRLVLYRQGATPSGSAGGAAIPMADRVRAILSAKSGNERKVVYLTERRDAISAQRDAIAQDVALLEKKDVYLCQQFEDAGSEPARRRAAAQLYALRKRLVSKQQLVGRLSQQLEVIAGRLEHLEALPEGRQMDAAEVEALSRALAAAEEVLAIVAAKQEPQQEESAGLSGGALNADEQAVYDELSSRT
jgi:hypothetical protein